MVERKIARLEEDSKPSQRYEVQFQKDSQLHSTTDDLEQAQLYARALANWNLAAEVYDRDTQSIVFRAQAYREQNSSKGPHETPRKRRALIGNSRDDSKHGHERCSTKLRPRGVLS